MAARRAITEAVDYDDDEMPIDLNNLKDEDVQAALEMAYAMGQGNDYMLDQDNDGEDDDE